MDYDYGYESSSVIQQPDEHTFLCGHSRVRRYGTTKSVQDTTPQHFFQYFVRPTDTLEGIALKHNCSISEIVRLNKLWSAQALHLKETLRIPIKQENQPTLPQPPPSANNGSIASNHNSPGESLTDILSRIDKSIKKTTASAKTIERHSSLNQLDDATSSPRHNSLHDRFFETRVE